MCSAKLWGSLLTAYSVHAKSAFWNAQLTDNARQPKKMWDMLATILGAPKSRQLPSIT